MDANSFRESVEMAKRIQLDRLGSSKFLSTLTEADLSEPAMFRVTAYPKHMARGAFAAWVEDETGEEASTTFGATAAQETEHLDRVLGAFDEAIDPPDKPGVIHMYLCGYEDAIERVAADTIGHGLVSVRTHTQITGFFVNEADEPYADLFYDLKAKTEETFTTGLGPLADHYAADDD